MPDTPEIPTRATRRPTLLESVLICGALLLLAQLLVIGIRQARDVAQLSLALHNYHDTSNVLPPGGDANGVPYH
jgi:hypothetical protein